MAKIAGPYTMPDDHAALIGRIAESWGQLEFQIDLGIWALSAAPQQFAACITSQFMSAHPRINAFIALAELNGASEKSIDEVKAFNTKRIAGLTERRNRAIHDPRMKDKATGEMHRLEITAKPHARFGFVPETKESLVEIHTKIHTAVSDFSVLRDRIIAAIAALP